MIHKLEIKKNEHETITITGIHNDNTIEIISQNTEGKRTKTQDITMDFNKFFNFIFDLKLEQNNKRDKVKA